MNKIKQAIKLEIPHKCSGRFSEIFQYPFIIFLVCPVIVVVINKTAIVFAKTILSL